MAIAIVDFCNGVNDYLAAALAADGLATTAARSVGEAGAGEAALILVGSVDQASLAFISELRRSHPATPQVFVSDRDDVDGRLAAYDAGADDCLSKPFHLRELVAKLRALRRRGSRGATVPLLAEANAAVDQVALELKVAEKSKSLTRRETDLALLLARAGGAAVGREAVLREAWGAPSGLTANLVDVYVGYLRRKLKQLDADVSIKSVRGEGFRLETTSRRARTV